MRLGQKLQLTLSLLILALAAVTIGFVYMGFQRTQDLAMARSREGLEDLGRRLVMEIAHSEAEQSVLQLESAAQISQELAAAFISLPPGDTATWDSSRLVRGPEGQLYDPVEPRGSDVFIPNYVELNPAVQEDLDDSAHLEDLFPSAFSRYLGSSRGESYEPLAIYFLSTNQVTRYYPPIGIGQLLPADLRLEAGLVEAGPERNPQRATVWSAPYEDDARQGFLITASSPVYEADVYRGRIGVDISMKRLLGKINQVQPTPGGFAFYVDRSGQLLPSGAEPLLTQSLETDSGGLSSTLEAMRMGDQSVAQVMLDGQPYFIAYSPLDPIGGSFAVAAPVAEITEQAAALTASIEDEGNRTMLVLLSVIAAFFIVGLVGSTWMNRAVFLRPIERLVAGTRSVRAGDFDVQLPVRGRDEMAVLAGSFNQMTAEIRQRSQDLEEEVRERRAVQDELQALFSAMADAVFVIDIDGRYLHIPSTGGPGAFQAAQADQMIGRTMREVMPQELADFFLSKIRRAVASRTTDTFEYPLKVDDAEIWLSAVISPMSDRAAVIVERDITETKRTEAALRSWQERHLAMVNSVDAILWEANSDFTAFTFVSEQAERLLGYPTERWLSEPSFWADHIHPEDREWCLNYCSQKTAAGQDHDFEYRMVAANGRTVWLRDIVTVISEEGRAVALRGFMIDITDLKEAFGELSTREEQYRAVFEASSDGLVVSDAETAEVLTANPAFARMHGWEDMVGFSPQQFVPAESLPVFMAYLQAIREGKVFRERAQHVRRDGSVFEVELYGRGFTFQDRPAALGVVRDITEQVRGEQLLEVRVGERTRELSTLLEVTSNVASTLALAPLLQLIIQQVKEVADYNHASIYLVEGDNLTLIEHGANDDIGALPDFTPLPLRSIDALWQQIGTRQTVLIQDLQAGLDVDPDLRRSANLLLEENATTTRSLLCAPLALKERVIGVLALTHSTPTFYDQRHRGLVEAIASQAAIAIENARLYEQAQQAATLEERQRLARELHDAVTQTLFATTLIAEAIPDLWQVNPDLARQRLADLHRLTRGALAEMRTLLVELRPGTLTEIPLAELLRQLAEAAEGRSRIKVSLNVTGVSLPLPSEVQLSLYRMAQESLSNILRHAHAESVRISLAFAPAGLALTIEDDGRGFHPEGIPAGHLGISIMRERATAIGANLSVKSQPGKGTSVNISWHEPLD